MENFLVVILASVCVCVCVCSFVRLFVCLRVYAKLGYRKTEEPRNDDAFLYIKFLLIFVNNFIQIHQTLPNLIKPNLT